LQNYQVWSSKGDQNAIKKSIAGSLGDGPFDII